MIEKLLDILKLHFGDDQGKRIYDEACSNYEVLKPMVDGESKDRQKNMLKTIFPFIAIYRVLLNDGMNKEDAMNHMYEITEVYTRNGMRKTYEMAGKPCANKDVF